jgi:hypothetical protein
MPCFVMSVSASRTTARYFHILLFFLFFHMACISNCCFYD